MRDDDLDTRATQETGAPEEQSPPSESRRQFTKAGLATPVLMTLMSRPVWGQVGGACSISGDIMSGNASQDTNACTQGPRCSPGAWSRQLTLLQGGGSTFWPCQSPPDIAFNSIFGGMDSRLLSEVIANASGGTVEMHTLAAYFNALTYPTSYSAQDIQNAYTAFAAGDAVAGDVLVYLSETDNMCPILGNGSGGHTCP